MFGIGSSNRAAEKRAQANRKEDLRLQIANLDHQREMTLIKAYGEVNESRRQWRADLGRTFSLTT